MPGGGTQPYSRLRLGSGRVQRVAGTEEDRMFIRMSGCADVDELHRIRDVIAKRIGAVSAYGAGTAKDPQSAWFETKPRVATKDKVLEILRKYDLEDRIQDAFPIQRGEIS